MKTTVENTYTLAQIIEIRSQIEKAICKNHSGKMEGMQSLSTSALMNPNCKRNREIKGSVCEHCYASKLLEFRRSMADKYERITDLLNADVYPVEAFPLVNALYFRLEAFGDLGTVTQARNYTRLCIANPYTTFTLFTKNPHTLEEALTEEGGKPSNLIVIYSSLFLNTPNASIVSRYPFVDKVFTVYDKETIERDGIAINCGARSCASCLRCYRKDTEREISEKLK